MIFYLNRPTTPEQILVPMRVFSIYAADSFFNFSAHFLIMNECICQVPAEPHLMNIYHTTFEHIRVAAEIRADPKIP